MTKMYLVFNPAMNESAGFDDPNDAHYCSTGKAQLTAPTFGVSTLAEAFRDLYAEEEYSILPLVEIEAELPPASS